MIVCSCAVISSCDVEEAIVEIMLAPKAPLPTPGVVFRQLRKRMQCGGCAPLAVEAIYEAMDRLRNDVRICPFVLADARSRLVRLEEFREREGCGSARCMRLVDRAKCVSAGDSDEQKVKIKVAAGAGA